MKLVPDWGRVLSRAWSVRIWAAASLVILIEPLVDLAVSLSDGWSLTVQITLRLLAGALAVLGIWARVVQQKEFEDEQKD